MQFTQWILGVVFFLPALQSAPRAPDRAPERAADRTKVAQVRPERSESRAHEPGRLGVTLQERTGDHGVLVTTVEAQSPAEGAGIKAGDRLVEIDGQAVQRASEFVGRIRAA